MYHLIQSKAHEIGSKHCCYNLYFMKCVFLTEKCYAFVHSTDQKIVYTQAILPTVACISNKSGAIGVQHSSTPLSPPLSTFLQTRTQTN